MLKQLFKSLKNQIEAEHIGYVTEAAAKMQQSMNRHAEKRDVCLFQTDYLE